MPVICYIIKCQWVPKVYDDTEQENMLCVLNVYIYQIQQAITKSC
jgi:hypothetical protein